MPLAIESPTARAAVARTAASLKPIGIDRGCVSMMEDPIKHMKSEVVKSLAAPAASRRASLWRKGPTGRANQRGARA